MRIKTFAAAVLAGLLSGCASQPEDVPILFHSTDPYVDLECQRLVAERAQLAARERQLYQVLKPRAGKFDEDAAMNAVVLLPTLFFGSGGVSRDTSVYALVKSRIKAVDEVFADKECAKELQGEGESTSG
ncbi:MAG: hypothetical protein AAF458_07370 [Pseudomonadota bacterium]